MASNTTFLYTAKINLITDSSFLSWNGKNLNISKHFADLVI